MITIEPAETQLRVGDEAVFTATGTVQYGKPIELADPAWRIEGDGAGTFDPASGSSVTTFTATAAGSAQVICTDDGVEGSASVEISGGGLPAPRKAGRRVIPGDAN